MRPTAASIAIVLLLATGSCDNSPPPVVQTGLDPATTQPLLERLDRLVGALEALSSMPGPVTAPTTAPSERVAVAGETNDLVARIENLERGLTALQARRPAAGSWSGRRGAVPPPMAAPAVAQFSAQLRSEDAAVQREARRSLFLLTEQEVLDRFGMPSDVGETQTGSIYWGYETAESNFSVTFVNGLATVIQG
ncbi:MAG TPA: hypothetical protein VFZ65_04215 [Planctomycetota bacterium]|nr:hypothetical protein [Planctomycetota bacterium]